MIFNETDRSNVHGSGEDIITALRTIDMIIGMNRVFATHHSTSYFYRTIAYDLCMYVERRKW